MPLLSNPTAAEAEPAIAARPILWASVLSVGLSTAFVDQTLNLFVAGATAYSGWTSLAGHIAATFTVTVSAMTLMLVGMRSCARSCDMNAATVSVGILLILTLPTAGLLISGDNLYPKDATEGLHLAAAFTIAAWIAWRSYPALRNRRQGETTAVTWAMPITFVPLSLLIVLAGAWRYARMGSIDVATGLLFAIGAVGVLASIRDAASHRKRKIVFGRGILVTAATTIMFCGLAGLAGPRPAGGSLTTNPERHRPRQVLLLTVDTLRVDRLGCYGGRIQTPHLDALAEDGVLYENAISAAPWTLPSFASMMTGVYPTVHLATQYSSRVPARLETLAERLSKAGLKTCAIGDNPFLLPESGMNQGFAEYRFFSGPVSRASLGGRLLHWLKPNRYVAAPSTDELADMGIAWIERHADQEFLLWLHFFDPHLPYAPPAEFAPDGPPPPGMTASFDDLDGVRGGYIGTTAKQRAWIQSLYDAEVRHVDAAAGRVIQSLKRLGIYENVHIVFASDHGEEFWEHGGFEHGHSLYQELIRVPLIIKSNRLADGPSRIAANVSAAAIAPTILDLVGVARDPTTFSVSALPTNEHDERLESGGGKTAIYSGGLLYYDDREAVIWGDHKYIRSTVTDRDELFDLQSDPSERAPLVKQSDLTDTARIHLDHIRQQSVALRTLLDIEAEDAGMSSARLRQLQSLGYVD